MLVPVYFKNIFVLYLISDSTVPTLEMSLNKREPSITET